MEKLSVEKRTEVSKMSTERLRAKLTKAGYDEDEVFEMDRSELLSTYAEYLLSPPIPESPEKAEGGVVPPTAGVSVEELELKRQKEERLQQELEMRRQEREKDLDRQRQRDELQLQRRQKENQWRDRENDIREMGLQRQRAKDEAEGEAARVHGRTNSFLRGGVKTFSP